MAHITIPYYLVHLGSVLSCAFIWSILMFPIHVSTTTAGSSVVIYQQVRNLSRRKIAYPFYPFKRLGRQHPKKHDSNLKSGMRQFLGPRNYKGEYVMNKYFQVPNNHQPNYIKPDLERGQSLIHPITGEAVVQRYDGTFGEVEENRRLRNIPGKRLLQPFPGNRHCLTNNVISEDLKLRIYNEIQLEGLSAQQVSQNYGLKIPRVEAIVKLVEIEKKWDKHVCITNERATSRNKGSQSMMRLA